ncbi:DUF6398 domain-containing protein [Persicobacter diffluens]|uniref:DUF6398 domain-containing protein n=1 Tax=Persicobacter diffluens TaxID=981 RepID=A0AAN5ANJ2_9BACT|nr:hypothetical protein PEDI_39380 [Persicobacter diffluens]
MNKEEIKQKEAQLIEMTRTFCTEKLNEDYAQLCEKLIKKMGRKREVPFKRGKLEIWGAAVVNAIGFVNFLFDKSSEPYVTADQIHEFFGTKSSTVSTKSKQIKEMFKMRQFDPEFSTAQMEAQNPFNDFVMIDGYMMPMDTLPENLQAEVKEARSRGEDMEFFTKQ